MIKCVRWSLKEMQLSSSWIISSVFLFHLFHKSVQLLWCGGVRGSQQLSSVLNAETLENLVPFHLNMHSWQAKKTPIIVDILKWLHSAQIMFDWLSWLGSCISVYYLILTSVASGARSIRLIIIDIIRIFSHPPHHWMHNSKWVSLTPTHLVSCSL